MFEIFEEIFRIVNTASTLKCVITCINSKIEILEKNSTKIFKEKRFNLNRIEMTWTYELISIFNKNFDQKIFKLFPQFEIPLRFLFKTNNLTPFPIITSILPTFLLLFLTENTNEISTNLITHIDINKPIYTAIFYERMILIRFLIEKLFVLWKNIYSSDETQTCNVFYRFIKNIYFFKYNQNLLGKNGNYGVERLFTSYKFLYSCMFLYLIDIYSYQSKYRQNLFFLIQSFNKQFKFYKDNDKLDLDLINNIVN